MTDDTLTLPHRLIDEDGELLCADCQGNFSEVAGVLLPGDETGECGERWKAEYTARCRERDEARDEVGRLQSALGGEITARLSAEAERDAARADLDDENRALPTFCRLVERTAAALGLVGERFDPEIGEVCLPSWHDIPERVERLIKDRDAARAELEEARLTLAAEQGRPEGAPSEGWTPKWVNDILTWRNRMTGATLDAYIDRRSAEDVRFAEWRWYTPYPHNTSGRASNARAAMLAADKAMEMT